MIFFVETKFMRGSDFKVFSVMEYRSFPPIIMDLGIINCHDQTHTHGKNKLEKKSTPFGGWID